MKAADPALVALLDSGDPFVMWEVYTVTLVDGTVITWVSGDVAQQTGVAVAGETPAALTG